MEISQSDANASGQSSANADSVKPVDQQVTLQDSAGANAPEAVSGVSEDMVSKLNQRLLEESKANKLRFQKAEAALAERQKQLEETKVQEDLKKGKFKELYEQERKSKADLELELQTKVKALENQILQSKFSESAAKAGCIDSEVALVVGNTELLQFDPEDYSLHGVDLYLEDLKKNKPHLFKQNTTPTVNPSVPGGVGNNKEDYSKLSKDEIAKKLFELGGVF